MTELPLSQNLRTVETHIQLCGLSQDYGCGDAAGWDVRLCRSRCGNSFADTDTDVQFIVG